MMKRVWMVGALVVYVGVLVATVSAHSAPAQGGRGNGGWNLPANAQTEKNPLTVNDAVLAGGKTLYEKKCQRCHGKTGKGDGPDAEAKNQGDMDLTVASRAARNPDGVVFYKIWVGRQSPKMPPMSEEMTKEQVWAVVAYSQTLRAK